MKRLFECLTPLAVLTLAAAGCSGGGSSGGGVQVDVSSPESNTLAEAGELVRIDYTDRCSSGEALTTLYADADGNLETVGDQFVIEENRPELDGELQTVFWDTLVIPPGEYFVVAVTTEPATGRAATDRAAGRITLTIPSGEFGHRNVALRDRLGNPIFADSTEPYSPRQTCGRCHVIDEISNGYHFQQGRTDDKGRIVMKEDFFADGRQWLQSAGMYGKW